MWVTFSPFGKGATVAIPKHVPIELPAQVYRNILVPLDHSDRDPIAVAHASSLAKQHGSKVHLLHVEEGVTSQLYGEQASTAEVEAGHQYLDEIAASLRAQGVEVDCLIRHSNSPRDEIVAVARQVQPDLLVMGAHGHKGLKDMVFGTTINAVRHQLDVPLLVVRDRNP
jgi:manganese transport protein